MSGDSGNIIGHNKRKPKRGLVKGTGSMQEEYQKSVKESLLKMGRTQIEEWVKARSSVLLKTEYEFEYGKRRVKYRVGEKSIEHIIGDTFHNTGGKLEITDIPSLHNALSKSNYIGTRNDEKHGTNARYYYLAIDVRGEKLYATIKETYSEERVRSKKGKMVTHKHKDIRLYSITDKNPMEKDRRMDGLS